MVQRNGTLSSIHSTEIVAGDIVLINEGMEVPADGWVIQSHDIKADESLITGENDTIAKESFDKCLVLREQLKNNQDNGASYREIPSPVVLAGSKVTIFWLTQEF